MVYISDQPRLLRRIPLDILRDRDLIWALIRRDAVLRYRSRLIGLCWAVIEPLLLALLFTFVFTAVVDLRGVDPAADSRLDYAALVLTALVPWLWSARVLERSATALTEHATLIRRTGFAREVIPLSLVASGFVAFLAAGLVLFVLLTVFITWPGPAYAALPLVVLIHAVLLVGAALLISLAGVHFQDMASLMRVLVFMGFFLTPIFYSTDMVQLAFEDSPIALGWAKPIYYMNPFVGLTEAYRDIMVFRQFPSVDILIWPAVAGIALFGLGAVLFRRQAPTVSDVL